MLVFLDANAFKGARLIVEALSTDDRILLSRISRQLFG
jgi:hypothetical protein